MLVVWLTCDRTPSSIGLATATVSPSVVHAGTLRTEHTQRNLTKHGSHRSNLLVYTRARWSVPSDGHSRAAAGVTEPTSVLGVKRGLTAVAIALLHSGRISRT